MMYTEVLNVLFLSVLFVLLLLVSVKQLVIMVLLNCKGVQRMLLLMQYVYRYTLMLYAVSHRETCAFVYIDNSM